MTGPTRATERARKLINDAMQIVLTLDEFLKKPDDLRVAEHREATDEALKLLNSAKVALTDTPAERYEGEGPS